jgi:hypothetical protein
MFVLLVFLSFAALAQTTTLTAPWLLVYDPEGRPRWEIRMENLIRTKDGWEGEGVNITLFFEGKPTIKVQAPRLSADPLGRQWSLSNGLSGEGQGLKFTAKEAQWMDYLVLLGFSAQGEKNRGHRRKGPLGAFGYARTFLRRGQRLRLEDALPLRKVH